MSASRPVALLGGPGTQTPRVLMIGTPPVHTAPDAAGGLMRSLAGAGGDFRYHLLGLRGQRGPGANTVVEPLYGRGGQAAAWTRARLLARLLRPDGCALRHFFVTPHPAAIRLARVALALSPKPSVHTLPSLEGHDLRVPDRVFADRTVVLTESSAVKLRSHGVDGVRVIRPAVPLPAAPADRAAARRRLALSRPDLAWTDEPVFLFPDPGRSPSDVRVFVEAAARLAGELPGARFVVSRAAPAGGHHAPLPLLRRRIRHLGLGDRVLFVDPTPDAAALGAAVDAVVLPVSALHPMGDTPFVLLQAMSLGIPAIVSDLPPLSELAGLGEGVLVAARSDPDALAERMGTLGESPTLRRSLGAGARRTVASHFRPDAMASAYEALYRELLP